MRKNIMLAFVSPVSANSLSKPIIYPDINGRPYTAIQTNESAIVFVERMLGEESLSKIFLIVSDSVKNDKVQAENEFGDVTHLEFLQRRIAKEFPQLAEKFSVQNYSTGQDSTKLEKNILQIAQIADAVMTFANQFADEKIIVHADMTGGFRHTSMLMLSIIQLLKYRGIEIGEVLYSEPTSCVVYRVTEIQRMFSLITGADEFVKFGSVEALQEYFGDTPPPAVKDLLNAMNCFSDAIKICRTSMIESELKKLGQHIKTFREHPDKDLKSELFAKIIDTIENEYGSLIGGTASRLKIIRWCMRKGFWQQAMTLCTEWLPEEIVNRKVCTPCDPTVKGICETKGHSAHKTWQQYFIVDYKVAARPVDNRTFCDELRDALICGDAEDFPTLKNFFDEYGTGLYDFRRCQRQEIKIAAFKEKFPTLFNALQIIFNGRKANPSYRKNFYGFLQTIEYTKIPSLVANLNSNELLKMFKTNDQNVALNSSDNEKSETGWENRKREYRELLRQKIIRLKPDNQTAFEILHIYHDIRRERNQINHANEHSTTEIPALQKMIENCLVALEKIPQ